MLRAKIGRRLANDRTSRSRLLGESRRSRMLEWLREEGSARVSVLAQAFCVSEVAVRQDLERLEAEDHVVREHGGAYLKSVPQQVRAMRLQHHENRDAKQRIGRTAAPLVSDGETIIVDSGSTTTEVAANLLGRRDMTAITNALNIALILGAEPGNSTTVLLDQFPFREDSVAVANSAIGLLRAVERALDKLDFDATHAAQERHDAVTALKLAREAFFTSY